jgi:hypothetical protein
MEVIEGIREGAEDGRENSEGTVVPAISGVFYNS